MECKKILIITSSIDKTSDYMIEKYSKIADFFRVNVDCFEEYTFKICEDGWSIFNGIEFVNDDKIHSIYYRKPMLPLLNKYDVRYHSLIQKDIIAIINGIADSFPGTVLSAPAILRKCENKIYQLLYAKRSNIKLPRSYIGNSNEKGYEFLKKDSIIKPISMGKTYGDGGWETYATSVFDHFYDDIRLTPVYLQDYVSKLYEVRITVIDNYFYPVRIDAKDKIDWRSDYRNHQYSLIECPEKIKNECIEMLRYFNLSFGAFDYIVTINNEWVFLEVNPNGQWLWLELCLQLDISKKIVEHLLR